MKCQLDKVIFTCCKCGGNFSHTEGTWLPVGEEDKSHPKVTGEYPSVISFGQWLKPPEIITSDEFTCYDCT